MSRKSSPPRSKRREGGGSRKLVVSIVVGVLVLAATLATAAFVLPRVKKSGVGRPVDVEIPSGASDEEVIARLEAAGVIGNARLFSFYLTTIGGFVPWIKDALRYEACALRTRSKTNSTRAFGSQARSRTKLSTLLGW